MQMKICIPCKRRTSQKSPHSSKLEKHFRYSHQVLLRKSSQDKYLFQKYISFYSPGHEMMTQKRFQGGPWPLLWVGLQKQAAFWGSATPHLGGWLNNSGSGIGPSGTVQDFAPKQRSTMVKRQGKKRWEKRKTTVNFILCGSYTLVCCKGTDYNPKEQTGTLHFSGNSRSSITVFIVYAFFYKDLYP